MNMFLYGINPLVHIWVDILFTKDLCLIMGSHSYILEPIRFEDIVEQSCLVMPQCFRFKPFRPERSRSSI